MITINLLRGENEQRERRLARQKARRDADPEAFRARVRACYAADPAKVIAKTTAYRRADPERQNGYARASYDRRYVGEMLRRARARAAEAGVPFTLTAADITVPEFCPVFPWLRLERCRGRMGDASPSLDRVIPALGYVAGNVQVLSQRANWLKRDATIDEVERLLAYMRREGAK